MNEEKKFKEARELQARSCERMLDLILNLYKRAVDLFDVVWCEQQVSQPLFGDMPFYTEARESFAQDFHIAMMKKVIAGTLVYDRNTDLFGRREFFLLPANFGKARSMDCHAMRRMVLRSFYNDGQAVTVSTLLRRVLDKSTPKETRTYVRQLITDMKRGKVLVKQGDNYPQRVTVNAFVVNYIPPVGAVPMDEVPFARPITITLENMPTHGTMQ